jgi:NhaP-type Na+/H+ or K+/H+ antiporter
MSEEILKSIGVVLLLGIGAQWLAWRLRLPSILLLLIAGVVGGPVLGWVKPDELLGPLLMPFVSVSVALILFEGGLTLKLSEWRAVGKVVRNLVTLGALVSWAGTTMAAHWLLGWSWELATLLGAILVVTGPTVIMPLLRQVQPSRNLSSALKWEGILIDPIGALLALLVFEAIAAHSLSDVPGDAVKGFLLTMVVGLVLGGLGAALLTFAFRRYFVPDHLQNPVALTFVVSLFVASNLIQHESGLLTATVMGVLLANQKSVDMHHVLHFKENLRVLLISLLFILLAARIEPDELQALSYWGLLLLLTALVVVVRPLSVIVATWGSKFTRAERWFLAGLAPRGVVAAAVASIFALRLDQAGMDRAGELVSVTFFIIIGTVTVYGLGAGPFARWLKVSQPNPQGALVVGANPIGRAVAKALRDEGFAVLVVDTNREHLAAVRMQGGATYYGSILSEMAMEEIDFTGLGRLLAMTPSNEVNFLASVRFRTVFGSSEVYQLAGLAASDNKRHRVSRDLRGRCLFGDGLTGELLEERIHQGATVKKTKLSKEFTFAQFRERYGDHAIALFTVSEKRQVQFSTRDKPLSPLAGQTLVSLVDKGWPPEKPSGQEPAAKAAKGRPDKSRASSPA